MKRSFVGFIVASTLLLSACGNSGKPEPQINSTSGKVTATESQKPLEAFPNPCDLVSLAAVSKAMGRTMMIPEYSNGTKIETVVDSKAQRRSCLYLSENDRIMAEIVAITYTGRSIVDAWSSGKAEDLYIMGKPQMAPTSGVGDACLFASYSSTNVSILAFRKGDLLVKVGVQDYTVALSEGGQRAYDLAVIADERLS